MAGSLVAVVAIVALLLLLVTDVQRRGRRALERERRETITQLADSMNTRVEQAYSAFGGITSQPYTLEPGAPADRAILEGLLAQQPQARTGYVLLDADLDVVNGVLLRDAADVIGEPLDREGLDAAVDGKTVILPVGPGLTTTVPVLGLAVPITNRDGSVRGVFYAEIEVSADSAFNEEVKALGGGNRGQFFYLDQRSTVLASTEADLIAKRAPEVADGLSAGLHRREGQIVVVADVPAAGWTAVNVQDVEAFEQGLSQRVQQSVIVLVLGAAIIGGVVVTTLLRRLRAAREEQRRLTELNRAHEQFTRMLSHELRTPVTGVLGFLQTTLDHWDAMSEPDRRAAVERATSSARRLNALTRDVMDTASVEDGELTLAVGRVDLVAEVQGAVQAVRELQPQRPIALELPDTPVPVQADPDRLQQVLAYYLDNATRSSPSTAPIDVAVTVSSDRVVVRVTDQGPGLPATDLAKMFDRYGESRGPVPTGGFGLYLSRRIVERHGGRVWAENVDGQGASFSFSLPRETDLAETTASVD